MLAIRGAVGAKVFDNPFVAFDFDLLDCLVELGPRSNFGAARNPVVDLFFLDAAGVADVRHAFAVRPAQFALAGQTNVVALAAIANLGDFLCFGDDPANLFRLAAAAAVGAAAIVSNR